MTLHQNITCRHLSKFPTPADANIPKTPHGSHRPTHHNAFPQRASVPHRSARAAFPKCFGHIDPSMFRSPAKTLRRVGSSRARSDCASGGTARKGCVDLWHPHRRHVRRPHGNHALCQWRNSWHAPTKGPSRVRSGRRPAHRHQPRSDETVEHPRRRPVPHYKDQGYEIAGCAWWQGHKDGIGAGDGRTLDPSQELASKKEHTCPHRPDRNPRIRRAADPNVPPPPPAKRNSGGEERVRGGKSSTAARLTVRKITRNEKDCFSSSTGVQFTES